MTDQRWLAQKLRNTFHSLLLIGNMVAVLSVLGWIVAGSSGLVLSLIVGGFFFLFSSRVPARWPAWFRWDSGSLHSASKRRDDKDVTDPHLVDTNGDGWNDNVDPQSLNPAVGCPI